MTTCTSTIRLPLMATPNLQLGTLHDLRDHLITPDNS